MTFKVLFTPPARLQASRSQELVDKYVNTKAAQDKETNAKVAALLNSKKQKLREMQASLCCLAVCSVCDGRAGEALAGAGAHGSANFGTRFGVGGSVCFVGLGAGSGSVLMSMDECLAGCRRRRMRCCKLSSST